MGRFYYESEEVAEAEDTAKVDSREEVTAEGMDSESEVDERFAAAAAESEEEEEEEEGVDGEEEEEDVRRSPLVQEKKKKPGVIYLSRCFLVKVL